MARNFCSVCGTSTKRWYVLYCEPAYGRWEVRSFKTKGEAFRFRQEEAGRRGVCAEEIALTETVMLD